jgi:hypothetical protein
VNGNLSAHGQQAVHRVDYSAKKEQSDQGQDKREQDVFENFFMGMRLKTIDQS